MRISDWSSDVCSSDLSPFGQVGPPAHKHEDQAQIAERIGGEGGGGARHRHDRAAYRRSGAARQVERPAIEGDRGGNSYAGHHVANRGVSRSPGQCLSTDYTKGEGEKKPGRTQTIHGKYHKH